MDDEIGSEFLLLVRANAVLSAFAVCTLLSNNDGVLLYGKSTATLPLLAVPLSVSVIGMVFPSIILGACLVARMLLPRLLKQAEARRRRQARTSRLRQAGQSSGGIIGFALESRLNASLAYFVVFAVPLMASLYCLWRVAIVPGFQTSACLLSTAALMLLLSLAGELVWFFRKPTSPRYLAGFAIAGLALAAAQLKLGSPVGHSLIVPASIEMPGADLEGVSFARNNNRSLARDDKRLHGANFSDAQLRDANLQEADLSGARMAGATLDNAHAESARFDQADLRHVSAEMASFAGASLKDAKARGADFGNSVMSSVDASGLDAVGGDFQGIDAEKADFSKAKLYSAHFWGANLISARFAPAYLSGASFAGAVLDGADFSGATLNNVHFLHASLRGANFAGAHLGGADFGGAVVSGAVLTCAHLEGTKLSEATGLTPAQLATTTGDDTTLLPPGPASPGNSKPAPWARPAMWADQAAFKTACPDPKTEALVQN
jgi:uncharacterized protein YjbI with pentapeptide repeats